MRAGDAWEASRNESEHSKALVFTKAEAGLSALQENRIGNRSTGRTFAVLSLQNSDDVKTVNRIKKVMCFQRLQAFTNKYE